ncbi:hypothetical protein ABZ770_13480 [Streptomyces sp. NPDC006654]|uniref:hypothetical protein n=1 Tax=unclassified Streptomyces TaxID=2593676 RepID=UPI0033DE1A1F
MAKSLDASDIVVTHGSELVVSPFDCNGGPHDDFDTNDSGGHDWGLDDEDRC